MLTNGGTVRRGPVPGEPPGRRLARQAAAALRAERLAAARAAKQGRAPGAGPAAPAAGRKGPAVTGEPTGDRALRSPATERRRAGTRAEGARRQAKRDSR